jgi:hypothetical protein
VPAVPALAAGRMMKLDAAQHALAPGAVLSVTSSTLQPLQEGAWTVAPASGPGAQTGVVVEGLGEQDQGETICQLWQKKTGTS